MKKSIFVIAVFLGICFLSIAQSTKNPLILITQENHKPVISLLDMNSISKGLKNVKALTIYTENLEQFLKQLKSLIKNLQIKKQQISSLFIEKPDLQTFENIDFEDIQNLKEIKALLEKQEQNLLLLVKDTKENKRLLEQTKHQELISQNVGVDDKPSQLFLNMTPSVLTGLLVTLFLLVILLIALNCLYDIKTNDQFGRNNLWVGKQS